MDLPVNEPGEIEVFGDEIYVNAARRVLVSIPVLIGEMIKTGAMENIAEEVSHAVQEQGPGA